LHGRQDLPGGAANTAANAHSLGAHVTLPLVLGKDAEAATLCQSLRERGVGTGAKEMAAPALGSVPGPGLPAPGRRSARWGKTLKKIQQFLSKTRCPVIITYRGKFSAPSPPEEEDTLHPRGAVSCAGGGRRLFLPYPPRR